MEGVRDWRGRTVTKESHDHGDAGTFQERKETYVKDEFGRDVLVEPQDTAKKDKKDKKERRRKSRHRSRSPPPHPTSTPPPADPFRPQLDERRHHAERRRRPSSRRGRSRSSSRRQRSRSRSPHRRRRRSRSRSRKRASNDKWTHDAFYNRSPSPMREVDPSYHPEPPSWKSEAGGVYIPKK